MKRMQHFHPLVLTGIAILVAISLLVWMDSQDADDAKKAKKIVLSDK